MISLQQIKQRKIVQWALAYLAGAWLILQLAQLLADAYAWSPTIMRLLPALLAIGLLVVLVLAWYHGDQGEQRVSVPELIMIAGILTVAGVAVAFLRRDKADAAGDVAAVASPVTESPATEQGSIAVLPFTDMSPQKDQAYFSDGLSEELLNVLAQIPELRVAARTSSFSFRDSKASIDSIARALRVEYVLEGSVRTAAERVRITAQLIKAGTGYHVWSNTYDRNVKDVFAVQDEISRAIVAALRLKIGGGKDSLALAGTSDPEAHALVLKGIFEQNKRTAPSLVQAQMFFEQAIQRDPNYARAHALLGNAHQYIAYRRFGPVAANYERAKQSAEKALQLDPRTAEAHVVLGRVKDVHDWRFADAEAHFARAVELNPGLAEAQVFRAWLLMRLGHPGESLAAAQRAVLLDPVSVPAQNTLGTMYSYARDYARSMASYRNALALGENPIVLGNMALTAAIAGQLDEAQRYAQEVVKIDPGDQFTLATLGYIHARAGNRAEAEAALRKLRAMADASAYLIAMVHTALGDVDAAFRELERAVAQHDDYVGDLGVDDVFDPLRNDPRMTKLLKQIGLPERQPAS
jgi:TolB-like protein/Tfp pilus assembly protein PilF